MAVDLRVFETASRTECAAALAAIAARVMALPNEAPTGVDVDAGDEILDAKAAAALLKVSTSFVQHRAHVAPLKSAVIRSMGRGTRFSRKKLERLITREAGSEPFTLGLRGVNSGRRPQRATHRVGQAGPPSTLSAVPGQSRGGDTPA